MNLFTAANWHEMFVFSVAPLELILRGTLMYWFIFLLLRIGGRRDMGSVGVADMLVLVLIADAAQNGMASDYTSLVDGMVLVATLIGWTVLIDRALYHCPPLARWLTPDRICLIRDGVMARRNMRREFVTEKELMSELRQHGLESFAEVYRAYIEPDGHISVIPTHASRTDTGKET